MWNLKTKTNKIEIDSPKQTMDCERGGGWVGMGGIGKKGKRGINSR